MSMRMQSMVLLAAVSAVTLSGGASAATPAPAPASWRRTVLVELFTSQGCSSCPPADAFVRELPDLGLGPDKVVPLTFHVDYWDHLGWKDPFASEANTSRQAWYAKSGRLRSPDGAGGLDGLYTPQMIVGGAVQFSGQRRDTARREMERAAARPATFDLAIRAAARGSALDLTVTVAAPVAGRPEQDWRVVAALCAKRTRTAVARGENGGETLDEAAVVRALSERISLPAAGSAARIRLVKPADLAWADAEVVVFAQSEATREIGAVRALDAQQLDLR
jgi:hypothetical protein